MQNSDFGSISTASPAERQAYRCYIVKVRRSLAAIAGMGLLVSAVLADTSGSWVLLLAGYAVTRAAVTWP